MIEELFFIEKQAYRKSPVHDIDARAKIILCFAAIVAMVAVPYSPVVFPVGLVFFLLFAILWALSRLSPLVYGKRVLMVVPFGFFLIFVQIFVQNPYYTVYTSIADLPFGIHVYRESVEFASILFVKFLVSISFIILLSSTTRVQDLLEGAGRLGLPAEFSLVLGMMVRYIFVFGYITRKVGESLAARCFSPFDRNLPYRYRLRVLAYTIGTLFIRSYEQGERTYMAMLCRGYGRESHLYIRKKPLARRDLFFLLACMPVVVCTPVIAWLSSQGLL
ncbi:MAG TPA: cobalt ECF transporter T component CbiQ [Methanolinea sp.]|nr:cobalt ECF transporter T component CbiQ [Methanolinea sp.]HQI14991.1 cobalt ECF transporter T component CbiQ [Methanolinea sp.]